MPHSGSRQETWNIGDSANTLPERASMGVKLATISIRFKVSGIIFV